MLGDKEFEVLCGDSETVLKTLPDDSVDMCVTSPPYFGLRNYHNGGKEIGQEDSPIEFVNRLASVFRELRRVLKPCGTLWLNLGDTYNSAWKELPTKNLLGIPWRVAFALQDDGWILRSDIIWCLSGGTYVYCRTKHGDMPMTIKDLARLKPKSVKVWNGTKWTLVNKVWKSANTENKIGLVLRSGERIYCTGGHRFPIIRNGEEMLVNAQELKIGDKLKHCILPSADRQINPSYLSDDVAWLIGLYLADGSKSCNALQFALNKGRKNYYERIKKIVEDLGCHAFSFAYKEGESFQVNVHGKVINAIIDEYIAGHNAKTKHLAVSAWQLSNEKLKKIMEGYLDGDGHYEKENNRYRLGFCRNYALEVSLRTIASRLGATLTLKETISSYVWNGEKRTRPSFRGEWRWGCSKHFNVKERTEIVDFLKPSGKSFYDIEVEDEPHLFCLASGILTHNSKTNAMPNSCTDRCTTAHEYIFMFAKQPQYYFDYEAIEEEATGYDGRKDTLLKGSPKYSQGDYLADGTPNSFSSRGHERWKFKQIPQHKNLMEDEKGQTNHSFHKRRAEGLPDEVYPVRRKRDVWSVPTIGYEGAHFATFPEKLVEPCILAGCPKHGLVMDCFSGAGTTGVVAVKNHRRYIGIELNKEYVELSMKRIAEETAQQTFDF